MISWSKNNGALDQNESRMKSNEICHQRSNVPPRIAKYRLTFCQLPDKRNLRNQLGATLKKSRWMSLITCIIIVANYGNRSARILKSNFYRFVISLFTGRTLKNPQEYPRILKNHNNWFIATTSDSVGKRVPTHLKQNHNYRFVISLVTERTPKTSPEIPCTHECPRIPPNDNNSSCFYRW